MSQFEQRVGNAISETRILVLGTQVLVGAGFSVFFQSAFGDVPPRDTALALGALALLLAALAMLLAPTTYHRIAEAGRATRRYLLFVRRVAAAALLPLALGLAAALAVAARTIVGDGPGLGFGGAALVLSGALWYGPFAAPSRRGREAETADAEDDGERPLDQRIDHLLAEIRVVIPGAQALLGFQLTICFVKAFAELPSGARLLHLASLGSVALATVLLVTPAAFHRIVEEGRASEKFLKLATRFLVGAMVPLAAGLASDFGVVVWKVTGSAAVAGAGAGAALATIAAIWFAYPAWKRSRAVS